MTRKTNEKEARNGTLSFQMETIGGYPLDEVVSALQKSIRRSLDEDAVYWVTELALSGYSEYAWRRLKVICLEDIGVAEPMMPVIIESLYQIWKDFKSAGKYDGEFHMPLVYAAVVLARAKKSRLIDNMILALGQGPSMRPRRAIPDYALDKHTQRGRKMGRGMKHFLDEAAKLIPPPDVPGEAEWAERARQILLNEPGPVRKENGQESGQENEQNCYPAVIE